MAISDGTTVARVVAGGGGEEVEEEEEEGGRATTITTTTISRGRITKANDTIVTVAIVVVASRR